MLFLNRGKFFFSSSIFRKSSKYHLEIFQGRNIYSEKKSEFQMELEATALRDQVGCSNHWATEDSMVSKGEMWVF